jgi:hypothetical protein
VSLFDKILLLGFCLLLCAFVWRVVEVARKHDKAKITLFASWRYPMIGFYWLPKPHKLVVQPIPFIGFAIAFTKNGWSES